MAFTYKEISALQEHLESPLNKWQMRNIGTAIGGNAENGFTLVLVAEKDISEKRLLGIVEKASRFTQREFNKEFIREHLDYTGSSVIRAQQR